jgi:hypothetical protein
VAGTATQNQQQAHPGNDYFVGPTGEIQRQANPIAQQALIAAGYQGPFTWAEAKKVAGQGNNLKNAGAAVASPVTGIIEIGSVLKAFFTAVTDWHLWASAGWIVLGLVLAAMGIRLWLGKPALPSPPAVLPLPV